MITNDKKEHIFLIMALFDEESMYAHPTRMSIVTHNCKIV